MSQGEGTTLLLGWALLGWAVVIASCIFWLWTAQQWEREWRRLWREREEEYNAAIKSFAWQHQREQEALTRRATHYEAAWVEAELNNAAGEWSRARPQVLNEVPAILWN